MTDPNYRRLYARISHDISQKIANGEYQVGEALPPERVLAETYGVSRQTAREAIIALEVDELVEVRMGAGVFVSSAAPRGRQGMPLEMEPLELLEARRTIEGETCGLAARRLSISDMAEIENAARFTSVGNFKNWHKFQMSDYSFHLTIARLSQNSGLLSAIEMLWHSQINSQKFQIIAERRHSSSNNAIQVEYQGIVDVLRLRNHQSAKERMRSHLSRLMSDFVDIVESCESEQLQSGFASRRRFFLDNNL